MGYREEFKRIKDDPLRRIYVLSGEEAYLRKQAYKALTRRVLGEGMVEMNYTLFKGAVDERVAADALSTLPFMSDYRLVEFRDHPAFVGKKGKETLEESPGEEETPREEKETPSALAALVKEIPQGTVALFYVTGKSSLLPRSKLGKVLQEAGAAFVDFPFISRAEAIAVLNRFARENGVQLGRREAEFLFDYCGSDLTLLENEVGKAAAVCDGIIREQDIREMCIPNVEHRVFELTDRLFAEDRKGTLALLDTLLRGGEAPGVILSLLEKQMRRIYLVHNTKMDAPALARALGENSDYPYVLAARQSRQLSGEKAKKLMQRSAELDISIKQGLLQDEYAVTLLVMECLQALKERS